MNSKELARCAVMTAALIAVQYALGFISGVELVTAVFASFCYAFGAKSGVLTAVAFSLLRCVIFGFMPNVVLLYLIYYTAFAAVFGTLIRKKAAVKFCPAILSALCVASGISAALGLPISAVYQLRVRVMLGVLAAILAALVGFSLWARAQQKSELSLLASAASAAAIMTVLFTLSDDVITPIFYGYSKEAAAAYFYGGFLAMLPQTVCAAISVFALFLPLTRALEKSRQIWG